jgi:hypothetical protein
MIRSLLLAVLLLMCGNALAANVPPPGATGSVIINGGGGKYGAAPLGGGLSYVGGALTSTSTGGAAPAGSPFQLQYNFNGSTFGGLTTDTLASFAAHNTIANGISYDPRDAAYGAICGGYNTFAGDGSTTTFTYTIPFTGSSSTDNTNFLVFYEPTNGTGSATILNTSQFSVTGVNSGSGGTITLTSAPPSANTLIVVHDDSAGLVAASTAAVASGGYVEVPDGCTIYGSQSNGTVLADLAQLIGQSFTPNYGFQGQGTKPVLRVIAPTGYAPAAGINISNKSQQFFEGFEITSDVPGLNSLGFLDVPVLIGVVGNTGAGGGQSPGIVAQYMTFNSGSVGFGAPIGGNALYIFPVLRFNNFTANTAGVYGPLSDQQIIGNNFSSNGAFGSIGSAGGMVIGPQQGAPGASGAGRVEYNRFEFNREGIITQSAALINMDGNQFDGNSACGLDLNGFWAGINITGGWFRGNGNGGGSFEGDTTAGQDAHICGNSTSSSSGGLYVSNVVFTNNYGEGSTAPIGSPGATTPLYVLDITTTGSFNNNININGGSAPFGTGIANAASITDWSIFRNGQPSNIVIDTIGRATQGKIANGNFSSQARGLPSNQWGAYYIFGDATSAANSQYLPLNAGYGGIVGKKIGVAPNYYVVNDFSHTDCDVVQQQIIPNINPTQQNNPLMTWLPSLTDPNYGAGFYAAHLADTNTCHLGALTWMATPRNYKVYAQSSGFVNTGTWTNSASYAGYYGVTSNTNGDTSVGTITTNGGPIYLWYQMDTGSGGAFSWQLDSTTTGAVSVAGNSALGSGTQSLGAVRIPVSSGGSHTINIAISSTTTVGNAVTIEGIGTPAGKPLDASAPIVVFGGQIPNATYPTASTAFNNDEYTMASELFADGLQVLFANVQNYFSSTDLPFGNQTNLSNAGQLHVADAFNASIQGSWNSMNAVNPLDYGASCNTQMFSNNFNSAGNHAVTYTAGSPVVSIANYTFQPGIATQNGGGDVGKVFVPGNSTDQGLTTYILSVDTTSNTATLGENMLVSTTGGAALISGFPSNPNDPSTAHDDTLAIQNASNAAVLGGGVVALPPNCMVHNLVMHSQTALVGNNGGNDYSEFSGYPNFTNTPLYVGATGFSDDIDTVSGLARSVGIDTTRSTQVKLKDFTLVCDNFPYMPAGMYLAAIGEQENTQTDLSPDHVLIDHLTITACPIAFNEPKGNNFPVSFTGQITGNILTVTAITSTNFATAGLYGNGSNPDFLSIGRPVTGTNVTASTVISSQLSNTSTPGFSGLTGTYALNLSSTTSSEAMVSTPAAAYTSGTMQNTEMAQDGIGINGDLSDFTWTNNVGTDYSSCVFLGPPSGGAGTSANRFNGGRCETGSGMVFDGGGDDQLTGVQFQATLCAITTLGTGARLQITGGWMQGNDCNDSASGAPTSHVLIGGAWTDIDFSGVSADYNNYGGGDNAQSKYFVQTATGSTSDYIYVEGGDMRQGFTTAFYNFANQTPVHYKQNVPGLAVIDTTGSYTATGLSLTTTAGGASYFTALAGTTTSVGALTISGLSPVSTTYKCAGGDITAGSNFAMSTTTSTSCALSLTSTVTSGDVIWGSATQGF